MMFRRFLMDFVLTDWGVPLHPDVFYRKLSSKGLVISELRAIDLMIGNAVPEVSDCVLNWRLGGKWHQSKMEQSTMIFLWTRNIGQP